MIRHSIKDPTARNLNQTKQEDNFQNFHIFLLFHEGKKLKRYFENPIKIKV
mgnify:FL=1